MKLLTIFVSTYALLLAQTPRKAILTWADDRNPQGTTYSVYRATGLCSGNPAWSKIADGVTAKTYEDATVQPGNYCYSVTATFNGMESAQSSSAHAPVPAFPPQTLSVTVQ